MLESPVKPKHRLARRNTQTHTELRSSPAGEEEPLSVVVPVRRYHGSAEMLPKVRPRLSSGSAPLEPSGRGRVWAPGDAARARGSPIAGLSLFYLLLLIVRSLPGSCCLLTSNLGTRAGVSAPSVGSPRGFYAK